MVERVHKRSHRLSDDRVIEEPARCRIDLTFDGNLDLETVPVHTAALMTSGDVWQRLRGLKRKIFGEPNSHDQRRRARDGIFSTATMCSALKIVVVSSSS